MKKTVMVVDDEQDFCFFLKQNLEATNEFNVITCSDGKAGLAQIKSVLPDVILLDVMMPGLSGNDIAAQLKEDHKTRNIPLVFLTAIVEEQEVKDKRNMIGGWMYVSKPVKIKELMDLISDLTA